jgi:hypothetical protein
MGALRPAFGPGRGSSARPKQFTRGWRRSAIHPLLPIFHTIKDEPQSTLADLPRSYRRGKLHFFKRRQTGAGALKFEIFVAEVIE